LEYDIGNVTIPEVDAFTYVTLSKVEKHVPYGELVGTKECMMSQLQRCTNQGFMTEFNCI